MKHLKKDVWTNDLGSLTLLERHGQNSFFVSISYANVQQLAELREAIDDALRREKVLANVNGPAVGSGGANHRLADDPTAPPTVAEVQPLLR